MPRVKGSKDVIPQTKKELMDIASKKGLSVTPKMTKPQILKLITEQDEVPPPPPPPKHKPILVLEKPLNKLPKKVTFTDKKKTPPSVTIVEKEPSPPSPVKNVVTTPKTISKEMCTAKKTKKNPNVPTKVEIVEILLKSNPSLKRGDLMKNTKDKLCEMLDTPSEAVASKKKKTPLSKKGSPGTTTVSAITVETTSSKKKKNISKDSSSLGCIERCKLKLRPHQIKIIEYLKKNRGVIVAHSMGSGKTLTAVAASQCILDEHPDWNVVVVLPKSLKDNFKGAMISYGISPVDSRYTLITMKNFANRYSEGILECNEKTFLIIDEAHNLKTFFNHKISIVPKKDKPLPTALAAYRCAKDSSKVLLMTGTPLFDSAADVINLVSFVRGERPITVKHLYALLKPENSSLFNKYFDCLFSFYESKEGFPSYKEHDIKIPMTRKFYDSYFAIEKHTLKLYGEDPWVFLSGLRAAVDSLEPCLKCKETLKIIEKNQKTVVYSFFKSHGIEQLERMLLNHDIPFVTITGEKSEKERTKAVKAFNLVDGPNVLFITKAGGEGLDLKGVRNIVIFESGWNRGGELQIIGRGVRYHSHHHLPEKERHVDVYHLLVVKPDIRFPEDNSRLSADEMVRTTSLKKQNEIASLDKRLRDLSIENSNCGNLTFEDVNVHLNIIGVGKVTTTSFDNGKPCTLLKTHGKAIEIYGYTDKSILVKCDTLQSYMKLISELKKVKGMEKTSLNKNLSMCKDTIKSPGIVIQKKDVAKAWKVITRIF